MDEAAIYNRHLDVFLLWACRETGVVEALLDGPKRAPVVAEETGITERAAGVVLDALVDLDYAERIGNGDHGDAADREGDRDAADREGDRYVAAAPLRAFDPGTDALDRGMLPHRVDSLENYMQLPRVMRTGEPPEKGDREGFLNFVGAMATIEDATVGEVVTTVEHAHPRPDRVLDVGGGPGRFGTEFARRGADVTLVDREGVLDLLADHHESAGLDTWAGDARESLPSGFDLVFSARMTTSFTGDDLRDYFGNAFAALGPGGTFACVERVRGHSEVAERFAVHMLTLSATGDTHTEAEYRSALADAGFVDVALEDVPRTEFQALLGRKPA